MKPRDLYKSPDFTAEFGDDAYWRIEQHLPSYLQAARMDGVNLPDLEVRTHSPGLLSVWYYGKPVMCMRVAPNYVGAGGDYTPDRVFITSEHRYRRLIVALEKKRPHEQVGRTVASNVDQPELS